MKGSPLLSTLTAILLMAGAYILLDLNIKPYTKQAEPTTNQENTPNSSHSQAQDLAMIPTYIEAHFSSPPQHFKIQAPLTGQVIAHASNLTENEWSGEIKIAPGDAAELNIRAIWKPNETQQKTQHFIQIILSPDQMDDTTVTLRSSHSNEIDTTASFQLHH